MNSLHYVRKAIGFGMILYSGVVTSYGLMWAGGLVCGLPELNDYIIKWRGARRARKLEQVIDGPDLEV